MYTKAKQKIKRSFKEFSKDLKDENLCQVVLMYGREQYLAKWAVGLLVKKYVNPASVEMDYILIDDELENPDKIIEACETFSMFSEKRIVWVKNYKPLQKDVVKGIKTEELNKLCQYLSNANQNTILIFSNEIIEEKPMLVKALKANGSVYNFETLEKKELISFAHKRFEANNVDISPAMLHMFVDETGYYNTESDYRLYSFENDILKVIAHSDGNIIRKEDILQVVSGDLDTFIFDFIDSVSNNQKDKAFEVLNNKLHDGEEIHPILGAIISQFELMLSIKEMRKDGLNIIEIHKIVKGNEYRIKKLVPYANQYSIEKLKEILINAYDVTWNINSGLLKPQMAMEMFIAQI